MGERRLMKSGIYCVCPHCMRILYEHEVEDYYCPKCEKEIDSIEVALLYYLGKLDDLKILIGTSALKTKLTDIIKRAQDRNLPIYSLWYWLRGDKVKIT